MTDPVQTDKQGDEPKRIRVAEGFYCRQEIDNIAWIDMGDHLIAVDALEHRHKRDEVFAAIEETCPGKPVRFMLNTHTHYDHVGLNDAFVDRWGTRIVNQQTEPMDETGRWFQGDGRRLHMLPMPDCHTAEDCIIWCPEDAVLFVGDIFGWGLIPLTRNLRREAFDHLLECYGRLIEYQPETVIPGHGPLCDPGTLDRYVEYLHWLKNQCLQGVAAGKSDERILRDVQPPEDMRRWWRFVAWKHADSAGKVLKAVRKGWLD